jgi:hypothetical protein
VRRVVVRTAVAVTVAVVLVAACERGTPEPRGRAAACPYTRADTLALAGVARDTVARLKGRAQQVTEITPIEGGVAFRTEDNDSSAFHNGGAVSFDCAKRVTSVWLDGG